MVVLAARLFLRARRRHRLSGGLQPVTGIAQTRARHLDRIDKILRAVLVVSYRIHRSGRGIPGPVGLKFGDLVDIFRQMIRQRGRHPVPESGQFHRRSRVNRLPQLDQLIPVQAVGILDIDRDGIGFATVSLNRFGEARHAPTVVQHGHSEVGDHTAGRGRGGDRDITGGILGVGQAVEVEGRAVLVCVEGLTGGDEGGKLIAHHIRVGHQ